MDAERLKKRYEREKKARLETERILEEKSRELFERNEDLRKLSESLEKLVEERTRDLVEARDQALAAAKAKSQFMANMSHEIRTPLNGVLGILNMFNDQAFDLEQQGLLKTAKNSGRLLLDIVNDILDFSKLDVGQLELHEEAINLKSLIKTTVKPLKLSAEQKDLTLVTDYPENFPTAISADSLRLKQILTNLLSNAIKFTDEGEIKLMIELLNRQYKLTVSDSGIGMSEDQVDRIFNAFGQADGSITREYGGTGLGLTITQSLVHMMGGSIQVKAETGKGSTFIITLPLTEIEAHAELHSLDYYTEDTKFKPARILLTEDNEVNQVVATHLLEKAGLSVTLAENGELAWKKCQSTSFDLVVMDIQMPVMDGLQASRNIRALTSPMKDVPIIAMTAHATEEHKRDSYQAGMNEHITKPIDPIVLYKTLGRYLEVDPDSLTTDDVPSSTKGEVELEESYDYLNAVEALKRLGGNTALFVRLIRSFSEKHNQLDRVVGTLINDGKFSDTQSLLHTIKGSAANIGANKLSKTAASFESSLKNGEHSDFKELLYFLEEAWKKTVADINSYLAASSETSEGKESLSDKEVMEKLSLLEQYLVEDISKAEELVELLNKSDLSVSFERIVNALSQTIEVFDISSAQQTLREFLVSNKV